MRNMLAIFSLGFIMLFQQSCTTPSAGAAAGGLGGLESGGGGLGSVASLVRSVTGQSAAQTGAKTASSSLVNSLNSLESQLRWIANPETGLHIYNALNNVTAQITGQASNLAPLTTRYPSVNVVQELIANLKTLLATKEQFLPQMTPQQVNEYTQKLQAANNSIATATTMAGQGAGPVGMGGGNFSQNMEGMAGMAAGQALANRFSGSRR